VQESELLKQKKGNYCLASKAPKSACYAQYKCLTAAPWKNYFLIANYVAMIL
jgi:hypothetical protein